MLAGCELDVERSPTIDARQEVSGTTIRLLSEARLAVQAGRYADALALLDSAHAQAPRLADIPYLRGVALSAMYQVEPSADAFKRALELDPYYPGVRFQLGHLMFREDQYEEAAEYYAQEADFIEDVRRGKVEAPDDTGGALPAVYVQLARSYARLERTEEAIELYTRALEEDSTFVPAIVDLAKMRDHEGDYGEALEYANTALNLAPHDVDIRYLVGSLSLKSGKTDRALQLFESVLDDAPWHPGAAYNLARALTLTGRHDEADAFYARADTLQRLQQLIEQAETEVHQHPTDGIRWHRLAALLSTTGRSEEALRAIGTARRLRSISETEID